MRTVIGVHVNEDGSGRLAFSTALDEEFRQLIESESDEPIDWSDPASFEDVDAPMGGLTDDLSEGAEVVPYEEGDFVGFTVVVPFASVDDFEAAMGEVSQGDASTEAPFELSRTDVGFEFRATDDIFEDEMSEDDLGMEGMDLSEFFDFIIEVSLPGEYLDHNADEVGDDGVLVWHLDPFADERVVPHASSELPSPFPMGLVLVAVAVSALLGAFFALLHRHQVAPEWAPEEEVLAAAAGTYDSDDSDGVDGFEEADVSVEDSEGDAV